MLTDGLGVGRIMPGSPEVRGNGRSLMTYGAPVDSQQVECAASKGFCPSPSGRERRARPACSSLPTTRLKPRCRQGRARSEEHTSELQSHSDLVCRLLLEKKKKTKTIICRTTWRTS